MVDHHELGVQAMAHHLPNGDMRSCTDRARRPPRRRRQDRGRELSPSRIRACRYHALRDPQDQVRRRLQQRLTRVTPSPSQTTNSPVSSADRAVSFSADPRARQHSPAMQTSARTRATCGTRARCGSSPTPRCLDFRSQSKRHSQRAATLFHRFSAGPGTKAKM